jgi:hypothetical protein
MEDAAVPRRSRHAPIAVQQVRGMDGCAIVSGLCFIDDS